MCFIIRMILAPDIWAEGGTFIFVGGGGDFYICGGRGFTRSEGFLSCHETTVLIAALSHC